MITQGKAHWAKIVGKPHPGYDKTKKEWSMDLEVDDEAIKKIIEAGIPKSKIKESEDGSYKYISFKRNAVKSDGEDSKPIRIVDAKKAAWDGKTLIGNGSVVNVSWLVNETEYNGKKFKKPGILAVQVVELVPYEGRGGDDDFPEYDGDGNENWDEE